MQSVCKLLTRLGRRLTRVRLATCSQALGVALLLSACQESRGTKDADPHAGRSAAEVPIKATAAQDAGVSSASSAGKSAAPEAHAEPCVLGGKTIPYGTTVDAPDGCNRCSCGPMGLLCSLMLCQAPRSCSGQAEDRCGDLEYCAYADGTHCGAAKASASAICQPRPDGCPDRRETVCGCDHKTYRNRCSAAHAGAAVLHTGACSGKGRGCVVQWVSYLDGETEVPAADGCNACTCTDGKLACSKRTCPPLAVCGGVSGQGCSDHEYCAYVGGGGCGATDATSVCRPRPNHCGREWIPVCGCDGRRYGNPCQAAWHGVGYGNPDSCDLSQLPGPW